MSHHVSNDWRSVLRSRTGLAALTVLAVVLLLAAYEHQTHILESGLLPYLIVLLCPVMHLLMHHGSHGGHDHRRGDG
jgi:hypothetical protein